MWMEGMHDWAFIGVALTGQHDGQSFCSKICKHCSASFQSAVSRYMTAFPTFLLICIVSDGEVTDGRDSVCG